MNHNNETSNESIRECLLRKKDEYYDKRGYYHLIVYLLNTLLLY